MLLSHFCWSLVMKCHFMWLKNYLCTIFTKPCVQRWNQRISDYYLCQQLLEKLIQRLLIIWKSKCVVLLISIIFFLLFYYLFRAGVEFIFALPWIVSWFGHSLDSYRMVVRLYDYFLASPSQYLPLYVAAAIVLYLEDEIFKRDCDLGELYPLFNHLPQDLPFEYILKSATVIYNRYPIEEIEPYAKQLLIER